jgi:hypothetical protein
VIKIIKILKFQNAQSLTINKQQKCDFIIGNFVHFGILIF